MTDDEELDLDHDEVIRTGMIPPSDRLPEISIEILKLAWEGDSYEPDDPKWRLCADLFLGGPAVGGAS